MRLSVEAQDDVEEASRWLADTGVPVRTVRAYFAKVRARYLRLQAHPHLGPPRDDLGEGVRSLTAPSATIFYRVETDRVLILRIIRRGRDVGRALTP